jgi:hypothetical protein
MALSEYVVRVGTATGIIYALRRWNLSGKKGGGVCFIINDSWCNCNNIQELKSFFLTWPRIPSLNADHIISQENSCWLLSQLCISPHKLIPQPPSRNFIGLETICPEVAFIVAGNFNKANLRTRLPKSNQHIDCNTRAGNTLDHCYSNFCDAYKALPHPSANMTTTPFCSYHPIGRNSNRMYPWLCNAGLTNRNPCFKIVLITQTGNCSGQPQRITLIYTLI